MGTLSERESEFYVIYYWLTQDQNEGEQQRWLSSSCTATTATTTCGPLYNWTTLRYTVGRAVVKRKEKERKNDDKFGTDAGAREMKNYSCSYVIVHFLGWMIANFRVRLITMIGWKILEASHDATEYNTSRHADWPLYVNKEQGIIIIFSLPLFVRDRCEDWFIFSVGRWLLVRQLLLWERV